MTDADLVAGRIPAGGPGLPGLGALDVGAAERALGEAKVTAAGVIAVVDANMSQAVRVVSVQRGVDPAGLALVAFGGAGPLHACALADALGMPAVVVPPRAGVLSAVGMLGAPRQADLVRSWPTPADHTGLGEALVALGDDARRSVAPAAAQPAVVGAEPAVVGAEPAVVGAERADLLGGAPAGVVVETAVDCRYAGQSHEITVRSVGEFETEHRRRNGFTMAVPVEVTALRATARVASPVDIGALAPPERTGRRVGPAVIAEEDCTIWVGEGWQAEVHSSGSWVLTRTNNGGRREP